MKGLELTLPRPWAIVCSRNGRGFLLFYLCVAADQLGKFVSQTGVLAEKRKSRFMKGGLSSSVPCNGIAAQPLAVTIVKRGAVKRTD